MTAYTADYVRSVLCEAAGIPDPGPLDSGWLLRVAAMVRSARKRATRLAPLDLDTVGGRIRYAREARGFSVPDTARAIGVGSRVLEGYERGEAPLPYPRLLRLATTLAVERAWLACETDEGKPEPAPEPGQRPRADRRPSRQR